MKSPDTFMYVYPFNLILTGLRIKQAFTYSNHSFFCTLYGARYVSTTFFIDRQNEQSAIKLIDDLLAAYPKTYTEALFEKSRRTLHRYLLNSL
jgi:hypothetical protein